MKLKQEADAHCHEKSILEATLEETKKGCVEEMQHTARSEQKLQQEEICRQMLQDNEREHTVMLQATTEKHHQELQLAHASHASAAAEAISAAKNAMNSDTLKEEAERHRERADQAIEAHEQLLMSSQKREKKLLEAYETLTNDYSALLLKNESQAVVLEDRNVELNAYRRSLCRQMQPFRS